MTDSGEYESMLQINHIEEPVAEMSIKAKLLFTKKTLFNYIQKM